MDSSSSAEKSAITGQHIKGLGVSEEAVLASRVKLFTRQRPMLWIGQLTVASLTAAFLWWQGFGAAPWWWLAAHFALAVVRARDVFYYQGHEFSSARERRAWLRRLCLFTGLSGSIWGSAGLFFIEADNLPASMFTMTALMGIATGGLPALTAYFPAYAAFAVPISLGVGFGWLFEDSDFSPFIAFFGFLTGVVYLIFARNLAKATTYSISMEREIADRYQKVAQLKKEAEQTSLEKTRFLAAISHDVSQPLYSMILFLETLRQQVPKAQKHLVEKLDSNTRTLHDMFNSMVELARLEQGSIERHERAFDLNGVVNNLVDEFRPLAAQKSLAFLVHCPPDTIVFSDSVLLARILRNLISNAIKYTDQGQVTLQATEQSSQIEIVVADTGCGIPEEEQKYIFQEYWRADSKRHSIKGLGLGLSVVNRLSRLLSHSIECHSTPNRGTRFTLKVPKADRADIHVDQQMTLDDFPVNGLHILVLEDDDSVREALTCLLRSWGCQVSQADELGPLIALADEKTRPPDLLISDFRLSSKLDGVMATQQIREHYDPQLPSIIVSGDFDEAVIQRIKQEAVYYLPKPVVPHTLKTLISDCV